MGSVVACQTKQLDGSQWTKEDKFAMDEHSERVSQNGLQWMSENEIAAITVPFDQIQEKLPAVMDAFGLAVVTDVMVGKDLDDLLAAWDQDLFSVVDEDKINSASEPVQLPSIDLSEKVLRLSP
jgi:hypothetical protein